MDHWDSRKPTSDQRDPIPFNQVLKGRPKTHQYATRREFARTNNFPIFAGSDIADFVSYLDAHSGSSQRCFKSACRRWQTVERNVFSLYFCEIIRRCVPTGLEKKSIGSSAAVHRSVGMLFVPRRKFGVLY